MSESDLTPKRLSLVWAVPLVLLGWAAAVVANWGLPAHDLDPVYLQPIEALEVGALAPRPWRHLSWGLAHFTAHLGLSPAAWSRGQLGVELTLLATLVVPWSAWVLWCSAPRLGMSRVQGAFAAVLVAWSPWALFVAGMGDTLPRWLGMGTALLGAALWAGALRRPSNRSLAVAGLGALALHTVAMAWHPGAVGAILAFLPLFLWGSWTAPARGKALGATGLLLLGQLLVSYAWVRASGQAGIASTGVATLGMGVPLEYLMGGMQAAWQLPALGALLPAAPGLVAALLGLLLAVPLLRSAATRPVGLLVLGVPLSLAPEAAAAGFIPDLQVGWTAGSAQAATLPALVACLAFALLLARLVSARPARVVRAAAALLLLACVLRGGLLLHARTAHSQAAVDAQSLLVSQVLVPAASTGHTEVVAVGDPGVLTGPMAKESKWIPEVPRSRRKVDDSGIGGDQGIQERIAWSVERRVPDWFDAGLWESATFTCAAWLGRPVVVNGPCNPVASLLEDPTEQADAPCRLDLTSSPVQARCGAAPPVVPARQSRDPRSGPWAALGLLLLVLSAAALPAWDRFVGDDGGSEDRQ